MSKGAFYYFSLHAKDEYDNKGRLSNIVQAFVGWQNQTTDNNGTENSTDTTTEKTSISKQIDTSKVYKIGGATLLLIIILNFIIWFICFRKRRSETKSQVTDCKTECADTSLNDNIHRQQINHSYVNNGLDSLTKDEKTTEVTDAERHNSPTGYARVLKTQKEASFIANKSKNIPLNSLHTENDLGYV